MEDIAPEDVKYHIDLESHGEGTRSISAMILWRQCYEHRASGSINVALDTTPQDAIKQIANHCAETADYLLEDRPLKEAIFRVFLLGNNKPLTSNEVCAVLVSRWSSVTYPRDLSASTVGHLLKNSDVYHRITGTEIQHSKGTRSKKTRRTAR